MNNHHEKGGANEPKGKGKEVAGKVGDNERKQHMAKTGKHGGKEGAVLGEINSDHKRDT